jgi:hypothetical protein
MPSWITASIKFICKQLKRFVLVFKDWRNNWGHLAVFIVPILLAIPPIGDYIYNNIIVSVVVVIGLVVSWFHGNNNLVEFSKLKSDIGRIENQRATLLEYQEAVPTMIVKHIFHEMGLTYKDRITIYRYNEDEFIQIGRYAYNPEFSKKGRNSYPKNKGFIGKCWEGGQYYKENLPIYEQNPQEYINKVSRLANMEKKVIRGLSMKSSCYYCKNFVNATHIPIAVVVIESLEVTLSSKKQKIDETLDGQFAKLLLESIENNLPLGSG